MQTDTSLTNLYLEVKKLRELQKRYWTSKAQNELQEEYKRRLLIECKKQESVVDQCIHEVENIQQHLAL